MSRLFSNRTPKRFSSILAAGLLVAIVVAGCSVGAASRPPTPTPSPIPTETAALAAAAAASPTAAPPTATADPTIEAAIDEMISSVDGVYGVVLMKPDGSVLYSRNAKTPFIAASLYKLVLMVEIYQLREAGELEFDDPLVMEEKYFPLWYEAPDPYFPLTYVGAEVTIEEALFATGAYSSNVAARALLTLTSHKDLDKRAAELGLNDTHLFVDPTEIDNWPPTASADSSPEETDEALRFVAASAVDGPVNITTPSDMCLFFSKLMKGEILSPNVSQEIFATLEQQQVNDRFPQLLPNGTRLVHKTGNLESVVHDVGIIYGPNGPVILAAMAEGQANDDVAYQVIQRLASIAYGNLNVLPITASPVGGPNQPAHTASPTPSPSASVPSS